MQGKIRTLLGDIEPNELGFTMAHEHILDDPRVGGFMDKEHVLNDYDKAKEMLLIYKEAGGKGIAEASTKHWGRNTEGMAKLSLETGINIVCCTGYLCENQVNMDEWIKDKTIDVLEKEMIDEVTIGMDGTNHKAGWIKAGTSYNYISKREEMVLRAAARASIKTGAPVHTHTSVGTMGLEQIEIMESEGMDLNHFCIAHVSRNPDYWYHKKMLEHGAYLIFDGPGKAKYYTDEVLVNLLRKLVNDGYADRIMLSNDMGKITHHTVYGYGPGLTFIKNKFIPRLLDEGFSEEVIEKFMIKNPSRFYSMYK